MPTFVHGRHTRVFWVNPTLGAGYDLSTYFNDAAPSNSLEAVETTTFSVDGSKSYIAGIRDGTIELGGFYDGTVGGIDSILSAAFGDNNDQACLVFPDGATPDGSICYMARGIETKYELKSPVSGAVTIDTSVQADGGVWRGCGGILNISGVGSGMSTILDITGQPQSTAVNYATTSTRGGLVILGVLSLTGTAPTISLSFQNAIGTSTWALKGTALTTVGGSVQVIAGSITGDTSVSWTLGGTNPAAQIFYGFARY